MPQCHRIFIAAAVITAAFALWQQGAINAAGQEKPPAESADAKAHAVVREEMRILAAKLSFEEPSGKEPGPKDSRAKPAKRHTVIEEPLLRYSDADRGMFDGTLWAYGDKGRPVAFLEMYCARGARSRYRHATTGTCERPLKLIGAPRIAWTPQGSAIVWAELTADKPPAVETGPRLRQIKALAKRFSAYQIFEPTMQREELRLLDQPLHRYNDPNAKIRDGAVFALALGTNPEALLFIEAREDAQGTAAWHYGWARRGTSGSVHGFLDGEEVWSVKRLLKVTPEDPHVHFYRSLNGDPVLDAPS